MLLYWIELVYNVCLHFKKKSPKTKKKIEKGDIILKMDNVKKTSKLTRSKKSPNSRVCNDFLKIFIKIFIALFVKIFIEIFIKICIKIFIKIFIEIKIYSRLPR